MLGIYCRTSKDTDYEKSTIIQQRLAGIKFAEENKFDYEIYEDEGISGFKISDDDQDPFKNRPAFTNLINEIKNGKIDKVWVWEISRLSRNELASAHIFNLFEKLKITLFENKTQYDLNDPKLKLTRQMFGAFAEFERQLIVSRTTRGLHKSINEGRRVYKKLYGYERSGTDTNGKAIFSVVESEMNNYKYAFDRYMKGATLMKICHEIYDMNKVEKRQLPNYAFNLGKLLRLYQYTGFQLTIEGSGIFKRFRKNEIESIKVLLDRKYWVKSLYYQVEIITIEDWITICERLQMRCRKNNVTRKERILRASKDIATGLLECSICGKKFYYQEQKKREKKKKGERKIYVSYFHIATISNHICSQRPRSFQIKYVNEIFKIFYFFFYIVFDNKNELVKESQRNIKQRQIKIKERIKKLEKETPAIVKRLELFQKKFDSPSFNDDLFDILLRNIKTTEDKLNELNIELSKLKIEYELQNDLFNQKELEIAYYDVKEKVNNWFFKLNIEEQRNELINTIHACKIYGNYILIDAGKIVFLFDISEKKVFDVGLLEKLNEDVIFKGNFVEKKYRLLARKFYEKHIININLDLNKEKRGKVFMYLLENYKISYNLNDKTNFVPFVSMSGLNSQDE